MHVTARSSLLSAIFLMALFASGISALAQEGAISTPQDSITPEPDPAVPEPSEPQVPPLEEQAAPDGSITPPVVAVPPAASVPAPATPLPDTEATFVINLRDADIRSLSEQVSEITDRTLVLDPNVSGVVTVISANPLTASGVWELFQSVLAVQGYVALPSGNLWRIVPQDTIREGGTTPQETPNPGRLDVITELIPLQNFPATTAVAALRPLVASYGYIEAVVDTNTLVITDTAENVRRIEDIVRTLDVDNGQQVYSVRLRNADATQVAEALRGALGTPVEGAPGNALVPRITVDPRSNTILVNADPQTFSIARDIAANLDIPGPPAPSNLPVTRVYNLRFADAASMAEVLQGLVGSGGIATNPVTEALPEPDFFSGEVVDATLGQLETVAPIEPLASPIEENISIQAVVASNAIIVRAREEVQADLAALIGQLDQRRPQVLIEAAIVEVSGDIAEALGVQLGFGSAAPPAGFAATSFSPQGPTLRNILNLLDAPVTPGISPQGLSIGLSREDQFGLLLQALGTSTKANLLSNPSITTLDNEPAEIVVGQNVPFRTGSFTSEGSTQSTIERRDVGITMRVVPRVNQGDVVQLDITQEVSSLAQAAVQGAADIITNTRVIKTTVLADNGGTIVLGGLISDDRQTNRTGVPGLSRLPVVGGLFRSTQESARRQTLFVFLRPTILRTRGDVSAVSGNRFQRLRAIEAENPEQRSLLTEPKPVRRLPVEIDGLY
ncbi:type II secretion system secretin GspD [Paracoccus sp. WLY502]|uniref:type II secretion system secretin GspD n=1 Tax=Paracoccus yibinensis TaxID=3068891 RepID=UPI002796BA6B|nr:type II secretion system secretin GspD [Paracoccus sp. WLY502]MDQ1901647.1 type II secretion system secretin GspD [Paracoccus sp. WLY502]